MINEFHDVILYGTLQYEYKIFKGFYMKRILINGHQTFGNRGCEALVRSLVILLRKKYGNVIIYVPSSNPILDAKQYPDYATDGVVFIPFLHPFWLKVWTRVQKLPINFVKFWYPKFLVPHSFLSVLKNTDIAMSLGGDMYTYESKLPTWILWLDNLALKRGIPVYLISSSLSDFSEVSGYSNYLKCHFEKFSGIAVREKISLKIAINNFNLSNVKLIPDIAFALPTQTTNISELWSKKTEQTVIGINLSPLLEKLSIKQGLEHPSIIIKNFILQLIKNSDYQVLLIPHVSNLDGSYKNSDYIYLKKIFNDLGDMKGRLSLLSDGLNCIQTKSVIGQCRFFIGTRMHSVIAALSCSVPSICISYSNKGPGIINSVFGDEQWSIELRDLSAENLLEKLSSLEQHEDELKFTLEDVCPKLIDNLNYEINHLFTNITH